MKLLKALIITFLLIIPNLVFAGVDTVQIDKCSLAIYPHNQSSNPTFGSAAQPFYKILSGLTLGTTNPADTNNSVSQQECRNRAPYDQPHLQDQSTFKKFYEGLLSTEQLLKNIPKVRHEHIYVNNSKQDSIGYFKSMIFAFEIKIENDGVKNTQNDKIECVTPTPPNYNGNLNDLLDCDGYQKDLWGGTKISKQITPDETIITWKFGVNSNGNYFYNSDPYSKLGIGFVPSAFGNNGDFNPYFTTAEDLTKPLSPQRTFRPEVVLYSKDNLPNEYWSATTTSRTLLRSYMTSKNLFKSNFSTNEFRVFLNTYCNNLDHAEQGWCPEKVNTNQYKEETITLDDNSTRGRLFWHPVGNVISIWQQKSPTPSTLACKDLQWDGATPVLEAGKGATLKFKTNYKAGTGNKRPLKYYWTSFHGENNRPSWFKKAVGTAVDLGGATAFLWNHSTPFQLLKVANAATVNKNLIINNAGLTTNLAPVDLGSSSSSTAKPGKIGDLSQDQTQPNPGTVNLGGGSSNKTIPKAPGTIDLGNSGQATNPGLIDAVMFNLGKFKDEDNSALSMHPLLDNDQQIYYTGGDSEVTLGVQAVYADGQVIPGDGAAITIPGATDVKQIADPCHLELTIPKQPQEEVTCTGLSIDPSSLEANKEATFTVTPTFSSKIIPPPELNYYWEATSTSTSSDGKNSARPANTSGINLDDSNTETIPGADIIIGSINKHKNDNWIGKTASDGLDLIDTIGKYTNPCLLNPTKCKATVPKNPVDLDTNINAVNEKVINQDSTGLINKNTGTLNDTNTSKASLKTGTSLLGTNIFADLTSSPRLLAANPSLAGRQDLTIENTPITAGKRPKTVDTDLSSGTNLGGFSDDRNDVMQDNPFLEQTDNQTFYTGGPAGTKITVQGQSKDGTRFATCKAELTIPKKPEENKICGSLGLDATVTNDTAGHNPLTDHKITPSSSVTFTANPIYNDKSSNPSPIVYHESGEGKFSSASKNPATCHKPSDNKDFSAPSECSYTYQAPQNSEASVLIETEKTDNVPACTEKFTVTSTPSSEAKCLNLNLTTNGQSGLNPLLTPGNAYALSTAPINTDGTSVNHVIWTITGSGLLIGSTSNPPGVCPTSINSSKPQDTLSICRYTYIHPSNASSSDGFSVEAIPNTGNVEACKAKSAGTTPPSGNPYCISLDLSYNPTPFNPTISTNFTATAHWSDKSTRTDNIIFRSTNNVGQFSNIINGTTTYQYGAPNSGVIAYVPGSNACQRYVFPTFNPPNNQRCTRAPEIKQNGTQYCAIGGNSQCLNWTISGGLFSNGSKYITTGGNGCVNLPSGTDNFTLHAEDCNYYDANVCYADLKQNSVPTIEKEISKANPIVFSRKINYSTTGKDTSETVKYRITFTPANVRPGYFMQAQIFDPAFTGKIQGYKTNGDGNAKTIGGTIDFSNIANTIQINGFNQCTSTEKSEKCYYLSKGFITLQGITINTPITIEYSGILKSDITLDDCQKGKFCNERFVNQSYVTKMQFCQQQTNPQTGKTDWYCVNENKPSTNNQCHEFYNTQGDLVNQKDCDMPEYTVASENTIAELVCQYFLTRASGDIFLEDNLRYGIDVSKCYPFKNITSTITKPIKPIDQNLIKSGGDTTTVNISHEICSSGQNNFNDLAQSLKKQGIKAQEITKQIDALKAVYGEEISKLSSQICEVGLVPGQGWNRDTINQAITQNIGKLTRWASDINPNNNITTLQDITTQPGQIYYYKGTEPNAQVTIGGLSIPDDSGAMTIIIENADLVINSNISYTNALNANASVDKLASLGVIVINGNIKVAPNVSKLSGAYFVQRTDSTDDSKGNITSTVEENSDTQLTIYGSVYGNIGPLFEHRTGSGDITKDEGAITIRYDQRMIQNTPPGLSDLFGTLNQTQIAQ